MQTFVLCFCVVMYILKILAYVGVLFLFSFCFQHHSAVTEKVLVQLALVTSIPSEEMTSGVNFSRLKSTKSNSRLLCIYPFFEDSTMENLKPISVGHSRSQLISGHKHILSNSFSHFRQFRDANQPITHVCGVEEETGELKGTSCYRKNSQECHGVVQ